MPDSALTSLDDATRLLVRLSAAVAGLDDAGVGEAIHATRPDRVPDAWVEELILQSHLFSGFPRALNAARQWRLLSPLPMSEGDATGGADRSGWTARGEATCRAVYGSTYDRLRESVAALHPALDSWMLVDGYGKVLGRPGLDLPRRELCIIAACAISLQDRQLHSHLRGARNVGVPAAVVRAAVDAIADLLGPARTGSVRLLLDRAAGG